MAIHLEKNKLKPFLALEAPQLELPLLQQKKQPRTDFPHC